MIQTLKTKKAQLGGIAKGIVMGLVGIVVTLTVARYMLPEVVNAGNNVSALGLPFSSLFSGSGLLILLVMIGLFIGALGLMKFGGGKK